MIPRVLFKYAEPKWADSMATKGTIRIGTLYDFRRGELGSERGDEHEGRVLITTVGPAVLTPKTAPRFLTVVRNAPKGSKFILDKGASLTAEMSPPDLYVYCATDRFDERVMTEFGGACVRINDSQAFFNTITRVLRRHDENGVRPTAACRFDRVEYVDREQVWPHAPRNDPVFEKPIRYDYQHEVRGAWAVLAPVSSPPDAVVSISPLSLTIPELAKVCTRIR